MRYLPAHIVDFSIPERGSRQRNRRGRALQPAFRISGPARVAWKASVAGCAVLLVCAVASAQNQPPAGQSPSAQPPASTPQTPPQRSELPTLAEMELPSAETLLTRPPVDWIVLHPDDRVLVVEPVSPRPDTLAKLQQAIKDMANEPQPRTPEEVEARKERRRKLDYLSITLPGTSEDENPEYELQTRHIKEIIYHEELMLRRVDAFIAEGKLREAFELLFGIERRLPNWPGIEQRKDDILFAEAVGELSTGRVEQAFVRLEELGGRKPRYQGLSERLGEAADRLIAAAAAAADFRRANHFLDRLRRIDPAHAVAARWRADFQARSAGLMDQAREATAAGRHDEAVTLVERAATVWPLLSPAHRDQQKQALNRFQRLKVGVLSLAGDPTPFFLPTAADERQLHLTRAALFEVDRVDQAPHYRSRFFEHWEPNDLGRQTVFTLRQDRAYWEATGVLSATAVVDALAARLNPAGPEFDERLASYVDSVAVLSPSQFAIRFGRVPLRTEALLSFPIPRRLSRSEAAAADSGLASGAAKSGPAESAAVEPSGGAADVEYLTQRFRRIQRSDTQAVYRRAFPEPNAAPQFHVAEIVERKYPDHDRLLQGLFREEIDVIPELPHQFAALFVEDKRFTVGTYSLPATHLLQFNPKSKPLQNRQLRGALAAGIDRQKILQEIVLGGATGPAAEHGRMVSAAWPSRSYAYNTLVKPHDYDLSLAFSLAVAAKNALGGQIPDMRLVCPPDPVMEAAARDFVRQWAKLGVTVELVAESAQPLAPDHKGWDILYHKVRVREPLTELWPLLTLSDRARVAALDHLPDWLRRQLIELDYAGDWKSALGILERLHAQLWQEVRWVPLWEVEEFFLVRKNIARPPLRSHQSGPLHIYQDIEEWIVR